jgi:GTPase SAR1 family protein
VEVWDVVDVAKKRKKLTGLKLGDGTEGELEPGLDAQFLDVYKLAHGAIFCFDVTKPWTFEYVKKELAQVPHNIPVLVLANFYDLSHHAQVTRLQIADFVENFPRPSADAAEVTISSACLVTLRKISSLIFFNTCLTLRFVGGRPAFGTDSA